MKKIIGSICALLLLVACSDSSDSSEGRGTGDVNFDRAALLQSLADNHIISDFEDFAIETEALKSAVNAFEVISDESTLTALRIAWLKSYQVFQSVAIYDLGPALDKSYYFNLNAHPLDVAGTEANINKENFRPEDLKVSTNQNKQGFPAVDYLVNGLGVDDAAILEVYNGTNGDVYKKYLAAVTDRIDALTDEVLNEWKGSYRETFVSNTAGDRSGALNEFLNTYVLYLEKRLRASKLGIPAGQFTEEAFPDQIESVFRPEESRGLLLDALENLKEVYEGEGNDTASLSSTLIELDRGELNTMILSKLAAAEAAIKTLDVNLKKQIEEDRQKALGVRRNIQEAVVLIKNDMTSALGAVIVFQDGDGD